MYSCFSKNLETWEKTETEIQKSWQLPPLVEPDILITNNTVDANDTIIDNEVSTIESNAELFRVKETNVCDGSIKTHSILRLMSQVPDSINNGTDQARNREPNTFNIFMGDVSGSMNSFWPNVVEGWNIYIAPNLVGRTVIMTFGTKVTTKRHGKTNECYKITQQDFDGSNTNLTGALQKIVEEVYACKESFINVFFVTDGGHNSTSCAPQEAIMKMKAPTGKVCNVYLLGAGFGFPTIISVNLRSRLHNGNANLPTIFWAKRDYNNDMVEQMQDIAGYLSQTGNCTLGIKLSIPGKIIPYMPSADKFHLNEYVYFDEPPETIQETLRIEIGNCSGLLQLTPKNLDLGSINNIFRQWNGILLQMFNKKEEIPSEIFPFMQRLATMTVNEMKDKSKTSIRNRIDLKKDKSQENDLNQILKIMKNILTKNYYANDVQLANDILSTTVKGENKYTEKSLRMKGHTTTEYEKDIQEFKKIIEEEKENIGKINVTPDDCCNVTLTCTVSDLQDEDLNELLNLDKFEFLKTFTMSGIPIYTTIKDSVQLNPWILGIKRILKSPYTIISQTVLESMSTANPNSLDSNSCGVKLQEDADDVTNLFNAVIPVFSPEVATHMNKIVRTQIYAMCCTFAIIKNANIIDYNVHMASLGIVWVRILYEHPIRPRPEYVEYRINCIMATAFLYFDRPSFAKYRRHLLENTNQALMTESTECEVKCESIIKPMFILQLAILKDHITDNNLIKKIMKTILIEYVGRCLSSSIKRETITHENYFLIDNMKKETTTFDGIVKETRRILSGGNNAQTLLANYYYEEDIRKAAKNVIKSLVKQNLIDIMMEVQISLRKDKIEDIRNVSACGDVSFSTLKVFAKEVGLSDSDVEELFSDENLFTYIAHAFQYPESKARLTRDLPTYDKCYKELRRTLQDKMKFDITQDICKQFTQQILDMWHSEYKECHSEIILPMTENTIIEKANNMGINVNERNFKQVYKRYRSTVGLLGNACQSKKCPWFLQPKNNYNEHAYAGRQSDDFPHCLHLVTKRKCFEDLSSIKQSIISEPSKNHSHVDEYKSKKKRARIEEKLNTLDLIALKTAYMKMECNIQIKHMVDYLLGK